MRIRLTDADRERLGCPEWLSCDVRALTLGESCWLADQGINPFQFGRTRDAVLLDAQGQPAVDEAGKPREFLHPSYWGDIVWLGLHRAGIDVDRATLDFNLMYAQTERTDGEVPAAKGKARRTAATKAPTSDG